MLCKLVSACPCVYRSKPLLNESKECGLVSSVLHYAKWTSYGLKWRYRGVDDEEYAVLMDYAGKSVLEV